MCLFVCLFGLLLVATSYSDEGGQLPPPPSQQLYTTTIFYCRIAALLLLTRAPPAVRVNGSTHKGEQHTTTTVNQYTTRALHATLHIKIHKFTRDRTRTDCASIARAPDKFREIEVQARICKRNHLISLVLSCAAIMVLSYYHQ